MQTLFDLADDLGVRIEYANLDLLGRDGDYNKRTRTIRLQHGMVHRLERSVLAHELAHATRGDERTFFGYYDDRDERAADEWAAHFLIHPDEYRDAEERHNGKIDAIASDLYVLNRTVEAYQRTLRRIGNTVYVHPKYGVGQYAKRYEVA